MKKLSVITLVLLTTGTIFGYANYNTNPKIGIFGPVYKKICIDGVWYIENMHMLSVYINEKTLKPARCPKRQQNN